MKIRSLLWFLFFLISICSGFGQTIIQSTCSDTSTDNSDIDKFSYEIALTEMRAKSHYLHDSILVPLSFLDSIRNFVSAYHNAIDLSDSIIDYRTFRNYYSEFAEIILTFDPTSNCFTKESDELIIIDETLAHYIDSLKLYAYSYNDYEILLSDTGSLINILGNFELFYNVSCITKIELVVAVVDPLPCYKSRSGNFHGNKLNIFLSEENYCDNNAYSFSWRYSVNGDCQIEILQFPTNITETQYENKINFYPNPFVNQMHVESTRQLKSIKFIGMDGQIYLQSNDIDDVNLNTSYLAPGLYLIEIKYPNGDVLYEKVIKK